MTSANSPLADGASRMPRTKRHVEPKCPLRPADKCSLCQPGATGPQDCGLVYLAMDDPDLFELYRTTRKPNEQRR